jgi:hypothetical protein
MLDLPVRRRLRSQGRTRPDLYDRRWKGRLLRPDEDVISADDPGVQALWRCHESLPVRPGRPTRMEFEYRRGGTLAYLVAHDVHQAAVFSRCEQTTGISCLRALADTAGVPIGHVAGTQRSSRYLSVRRRCLNRPVTWGFIWSG